MKHNIIKRFAATFLCIILFAIGASAQAAADAKYKEGLSYQKTMTKASQKKAIACFSSAKKMYDSAKNKKQCDAAIQVSKNIINGITPSPNPKPNPRPKQNQKQEEVQTLEISNSHFSLECESKSVSVSVTTKQDSWEADPISNADGMDFLTIQKKDDDTFEIICSANTSTKKRSQRVKVTAGGKEEYITVEQQGKPVILRLGENLWECSWKGGDKTIEIYCNSETTVSDNNEQNWHVESKPNWVSVTFATKKKQGIISKAISGAKKLVKGGVEVTDDPTLKQTMANIVVEKLKSGTTEFSAGRKGEVVFASDDQRATLMIVQKGK